MLMAAIFIIGNITFSETQDEDMNQVQPASYIFHSLLDEPALVPLTTINNCTCRVNPSKFVVCFGVTCEIFPAMVIVTEPLFQLKLTSVYEIQKNDFQTLSEIEGLEIEANINLFKISPGCFRYMSRLRNLTISSNENLRYLEDNVFEGLVSVETLRLDKNGFNNVIDITRALSGKMLPTLNILDISENVIDSIEENEFEPMNESIISELNMILCKTKFIHPNCLAPIKNLSSIRLGMNSFDQTILTNFINRTVDLQKDLSLLNLYDSGLRYPAYPLLEAIGKSKIDYLNMAKNIFNYIDDDFFPVMPNLGNLDVRECGIKYISSNAFKNLTKLVILLLGGNSLYTIPVAVKIEKLLHLDVAGNLNYGLSTSYFNIPKNIFQNMSVLEDLQLCYNNIGYIKNFTFFGLEQLLALNLKNTSLYRIDSGTFLTLPQLIHLNLMNNELLGSTLTSDTFLGLENLNELLLGGCSLTNLSNKPSIFTHMKNITYLSLERNRLHTIAPNQIEHLKLLIYLRISENNLTPWNQRIFPQTLTLKKLIAFQNRLSYVTNAMMDDWKPFEMLYLDGNPFTCDCSLFSIAKWLKNDNLHLSKANYDLVAKCLSPDKWQKKSILLYVQKLIADPSECEDFFTFYKTYFIITVCILIVFIILFCILIYFYRWYIRYWIFLSRVSFTKHNFWKYNKSKSSSTPLYKYDAFVSYSNEDSTFVHNLVAILENNEPDLKLCIYERDFEIGANISHAILENVVRSKRTLLIISNAFAKSQWCRWETQLAEYHQIFFQNDDNDGPDDTLLMIKLEPILKKCLTPTLRYLLKTRIYLEWDCDEAKQDLFWKKLKLTLGAPKKSAKNK